MQPQANVSLAGRPLSEKAHHIHQTVTPMLKFFFESAWAKHFGEPHICDFTIGNPHDTAMDDFVNVLKR